MFKNKEYSSFLNISIVFVLKHFNYQTLFRPLEYILKPRRWRTLGQEEPEKRAVQVCDWQIWFQATTDQKCDAINRCVRTLKSYRF